MTEQTPGSSEVPDEFMGQKLSEEDKARYKDHLKAVNSPEAKADDKKNDDVGDEFAR